MTCICGGPGCVCGGEADFNAHAPRQCYRCEVELTTTEGPIGEVCDRCIPKLHASCCGECDELDQNCKCEGGPR